MMPDVEHKQILVLPQKASHIKAYHEAMQWPESLKNKLHPAYLAMFALNFQAPLILHPKQPFAAMGLVHMSNAMHFSRLADCNETLHCRCRFGTVWEQKRGWVFAVITTFTDEHDHLVLTLESHYLFRTNKRLSASDLPEYTPAKIAFEAFQYNKITEEELKLDSGLGRTYARLSGDYNPIHLHPWTSRWFGFKQPIIHGMWSKARGLSILAEHWSTEAVNLPMKIHVQFTNFVTLPNQIKLQQKVLQTDNKTKIVAAGLPSNYEPGSSERPYFLIEVSC